MVVRLRSSLKEAGVWRHACTTSSTTGPRAEGRSGDRGAGGTSTYRESWACLTGPPSSYLDGERQELRDVVGAADADVRDALRELRHHHHNNSSKTSYSAYYQTLAEAVPAKFLPPCPSVSQPASECVCLAYLSHVGL